MERVAVRPQLLAKDGLALLERIVYAKDRPTIFLVGSALTMQSSPDVGGVPDVRGMVTRLSRALQTCDDDCFGRALESAQSTNSSQAYGEAYRAGFNAVIRYRGQDEANRIIREAVLEAHEPVDPEQRERLLSSNRAIYRKACGGLLDRVEGWRPLRPSIQALAQVALRDTGRFPCVVTTNFDPLLEVAVRRAAGHVRCTILSRDGNPDQHQGTGVHIVYAHGYWFGADTLHTEVQLRHERPQLKFALKDWLGSSSLVVMGYGGWDDMLMSTIVELANDAQAHPDICWVCYGARNEDVALKLRPAGTRVQFFEHVDMHAFLPILRDRIFELTPGTGDDVRGSEQTVSARSLRAESGKTARPSHAATLFFLMVWTISSMLTFALLVVTRPTATHADAWMADTLYSLATNVVRTRKDLEVAVENYTRRAPESDDVFEKQLRDTAQAVGSFRDSCSEFRGRLTAMQARLQTYLGPATTAQASQDVMDRAQYVCATELPLVARVGSATEQQAALEAKWSAYVRNTAADLVKLDASVSALERALLHEAQVDWPVCPRLQQ